MGMCKKIQIGEMSKRIFKSKSNNSKVVLEIVHTNICEPIGREMMQENFGFSQWPLWSLWEEAW